MAQVLDRSTTTDLVAMLGASELPADAQALAELLTGLEALKAAAAGVQVRASVALAQALLADQRARGVPAARLGRGVASAVAMARRESPAAGDRWLGFARALADEMPRMLALVQRGVLSEYRASLVVRETACLTLEDRRAVDERLAANPQLPTWGSKSVADEARRIAHELDPRAAAERYARAVIERNVTLRPAPESMTYLTALLPLQQGVACLAALRKDAAAARAGGDPRSLGQVMADTLVERVTGQATAEAVGVGVYLVVSDETLLAGGRAPAHVLGAGSIPAPIARGLVAHALRSDGVAAWVRRLYQAPESGELVALDSRSRTFTQGLAALITARDQSCRTPWCDAPIRHLDHVIPHEEGGATSLANGQGLCEACNHAKQAPRWRSLPRAGPRAEVEVTTSTGQTVRARAPDAPWALAARRIFPLDVFYAPVA